MSLEMTSQVSLQPVQVVLICRLIMTTPLPSSLCRRRTLRAAVRAVLSRRTKMRPEMLDRLNTRLKVLGAKRVCAVRQWAATQKKLDPRLVSFFDKVLAPDDLPPFGDFVPIAHLADGGMGRVWLCGHADGQLVVVKTIRCELSNENFLSRFEREARITCSLRHPHVVTALGHGRSHSGEMWLALEYINGADLSQLLKRRRHLGEVEALRIIRHAADGINAAHQLQLVHRDIKPANIFLDLDLCAKIGDFGCARSTEETRTLLTMDGATLGTPAYMSPEQIRADADIDIRSDIYALGVVLYACLCGRTPFIGPTAAILRGHLNDAVPEPSSLRNDLNRGTATILTTCLAKAVADRYQCPADLIAALDGQLRDLGADPYGGLDASTITDAMPAGSVMEETAEVTPPSGPDPEWTPLPCSIETAPSPPRDATTPMPASASSATPATQLPLPESLPAEDESGDDLLDDQPTLMEADLKGLSAEDDALQTLQSDATAEPSLPRHGLETASSQHWLRLDWQGQTILLWAMDSLSFGKLRTKPVDYCLRVYPLELERQRCQMISRQHFRLAYDFEQRRVTICDDGSANGTRLDGRILNPQQAWPLHDGQTHIVGVPNAIDLELCALPQRTRQVPAPSAPQGPLPGGIDSDAVYDAVLIRRPHNRPQLHAALVQRRVVIGPSYSDIPLSGWSSEGVEMAIYGGRWMLLENGVWSPLICSCQLASGLNINAAHYEVFQ
ncbi:MAG: FHA domain-containing protein [Planctomycetota bacterium]|nr:MAG: FHA domain-containing protein [Planctomycetota bacterium]